MKAILEFNLPEDKEYFDMANRSQEAFIKLWDIESTLRSIEKHDYMADKDKLDVVEMIREMIHEDGLMALVQ